jgi:hypothetical protein
LDDEAARVTQSIDAIASFRSTAPRRLSEPRPLLQKS